MKSTNALAIIAVTCCLAWICAAQARQVTSNRVDQTLLNDVEPGQAAQPAAADSAEQAPSTAQLIEQAKAHLRPVSDADVAGALDDLREAANRLNRQLQQDPEQGAAWREELLLDDLQQQLSSGKPEVATLQKIYSRFASGRYGLNLSKFADVRRAMVHYVQLANARADEHFEKVYQDYLDALAKSLAAYESDPTPASAQPIGKAIGTLTALGQAPALVDALRARLARPNLYVQVSEPVAVAGFDRSVDQTEPISDCILGTTVRGTGHTTGQTTGSLAPNDQFAVIDVTFLGTNRSDNRGFNGPVTIYSKGKTGIGARTRIYVDENGLHALPTKASARVKSNITAICDRRGRQMVERIAWKKAGQQKCQAEAIAAQHAERRASARIDQEVGEAVAKANQQFTDKFRQPLTERNLFPQTLDFRSTDEQLRVTWLQAGDQQIAAPGDPPPLGDDVAIGLRIHESMVNNMAQTALGGMTVHEQPFQADVKRLLGRLPDRLRTPPGEEPWGIGFADRLPIELDVSDGQFTVILRGRKYHKGDQRHPGMNVSATYRIATDGGVFRAVRQGDVQIFPPGFDPEKDRLSTRQQVIRTLLEKRFATVFADEFTLEPLEMKDEWEKLGKLPPAQFEAHGDWLIVGWKLPE